MIEVSEILSKVRARLNDNRIDNYMFSDSVLIDSLNQAILNITLEFRLNRQITRQVLDNENKFLSIHNLLGIESAKFNNKELEERTNLSKESGEIELLILSDKLSVTPFRDGELEVVFFSYIEVNNVLESVSMPRVCLEALVYSVLTNILEIPTNESNYETHGFSVSALSKKYKVSVSLIRKFKNRDNWEKNKISNEASVVLKDKLTEEKMGLFLDTKKEEIKDALKKSLEHLDLEPVVMEAIAETSSDELILKAMNTAYIKKQILFCAIVARGELIKMIKRAGDKVKDNINIIVAAEKVSKLFIDAGVSLFGKEQIQVVESKENNNYKQMNMQELIALANANGE